MVAIRLQARCAHCDYDDLEMSTVEGEEGVVVCPYCRGMARLADLQAEAVRQTELFKTQGLAAVTIDKKRYFG